MFISFDEADYETATRLNSCLESFIRENRDLVDFTAAFSTPFTTQCGRVSSDLYLSICTHVDALVPAYRFINSAGWKRWAGIFAGVAYPNQISEINLDDVLEFLSLLHQALSATPQNQLSLLIISNQTKWFMFDTFSDVARLTEVAFHYAIFSNKDTSRKILSALSDFRQIRAVDLATLSHLPSTRFRGEAFDKLRIQLVETCLLALEITRVYDAMRVVDSSIARVNRNDKEFMTCRFQVLLEALSQLCMIIKAMFGAQNMTIALLCQSVVFNIDIDVADNFYAKLDEAKCVGQISLAGNHKTPAAMRAWGLWSMTITFNNFGRPFLYRFSFRGELRRLLVIDQVSSRPLLHSKSVSSTNRFEALALELSSDLSLSLNYDLSSTIDAALTSILSDPNNCHWCHSFESETTRKRWVKNKSRKYSKLLDRLQQGISSFPIEKLLEERETSVAFLMERLQKSVQDHRKLPGNLLQSVQRRPTDEEIVQACEYLKPWTSDELHQLRHHMIQLEKLLETITGFFSTATGGAFPTVYATTSPNWTMRQHIRNTNKEFTPESFAAIRDMMYIRAILEVTRTSQKLPSTSVSK